MRAWPQAGGSRGDDSDPPTFTELRREAERRLAAIPGLAGGRHYELREVPVILDTRDIGLHLLRSWTHGPHRVCGFEILGSFESKK